MIKEAIDKIVQHGDLSYDEAYTTMREIMGGKTSPTQNAAFLAALSTKSTKAETIDEISGCAAAMRELATPVPHPGIETLEIVGTGGIAPVPSTSRRLRRCCARRQVRRSPSMATGPPARSVAPQTASRRSV